MKSRTASIGLSVGIAGLLASCMPSEYAYLNTSAEKHETWVAACDGGEPDPLVRARYCDLVSKSEFVTDSDYLWALQSAGNAYYEQSDYEQALTRYQQAVDNGASGDAYGNLAYAHEKLGNFETAIELYQVAFQETNDGEYMREAGLLDEALLAGADYEVWFNGFYCGTVKSDEGLHKPSEVYIQVVSQDVVGEGGVFHLPYPDETYNNVRAGYNSTRAIQGGGQQIVFYPGPFVPATLSVAMWEYDNGGPMIDAAVELAPALIGARGGSGKPNVITKTRVSSPPGQRVQNSSSPSGLIGRLTEGLKQRLGTHNDFMGSGEVTNIVAADLYETAHLKENGIPHHFKTRHRANGFDCTVYFLIGAESPANEEYERRVIEYIDAAIED
ncbi:MAG: tetratricopeptide repeat protein [Pseudomonadota bacterium]